MGCEEIRDLLALYAGGESHDSERASVEAHVAICAACARELDQYREARAALTQLREGDAPPGAIKSVWTGVRGEFFPRSASARPLRLGAALRYAAVVLVGMTIGLLLHHTQRRAGPGAWASRPVSPINGVAPAVQPVNLAPRPVLNFRSRIAPPRESGYYLPRVETIPAGGEKDF